MTIIEALADRHLFGGQLAFRDLASRHGWLTFLSNLWMPKPLRFLIVGENPDDVTSQYFYEAPPVASGQGIDALG